MRHIKSNFIPIFVAGLLFFFNSTAMAVTDRIPPHGAITFKWTKKGQTMTPPGVIIINNPTGTAVDHDFGNPPAGATDIRQQVWGLKNNGSISDVMIANIKQVSGVWEYQPLSELPEVEWKIPDLIQTSPSFSTLYTAVNLDIYISSNPSPSISLGDVLTVDNGQISGLEGIYWSTTEFTFDQNSATGFVGTSYTGTGEVIAFHAVPEPSTVLLIGTGLALLAGARRKKLA